MNFCFAVGEAKISVTQRFDALSEGNYEGLSD
jgi:hypothetical protein